MVDPSSVLRIPWVVGWHTRSRFRLSVFPTIAFPPGLFPEALFSAPSQRALQQMYFLGMGVASSSSAGLPLFCQPQSVAAALSLELLQLPFCPV